MKTRNRLLSLTLTFLLAAGIFITTPPLEAHAADSPDPGILETTPPDDDSQEIPNGGGI